MAPWLTVEELERSKALSRRVEGLLYQSDKLQKTWKAKQAVEQVDATTSIHPKTATTRTSGTGIVTGAFSGRSLGPSSSLKRKVDLSGFSSSLNKSKSAAPSATAARRKVDEISTAMQQPGSVRMPDWWSSSLKPGEKKRVQTKERNTLGLFGEFKDAKNAWMNNPQNTSALRAALQKLERVPVSVEILIQSKIMEAQNLPQLLPGTTHAATLPFDIQADAKSLHTKWFKGDFESHILRGIKIARVPSLDQSWPHGSSAKFFGEGHLVNGQWWPSQLCALRDGAHGAPVAGIFGYQELAVSIVVAHSKYADIDNGDVLDYCGTEGKCEGQPTADTLLMMNSCDKQQSVRVLRSSSLSSKYAPATGYRYDGLYRVAQYQIISASTSHYLFYLERMPNQHPIRYAGNTKRPTSMEMLDYQRHKLGMKGEI